eukprot:403330825
MEKRKDSDKKVEILDQLGAENDAEFTKNFVKDIEIILMSCKVSKFNKYNWQQERNLIVTNENIYNFKQKKVKRIIPIDRLAGLTRSQHKQSKEFVIHVKKEHDYRLKSDMREKIFQVVKMAYTSKSKTNLPIYGIKNKDLREFATTEKDIDKGISRQPLQLARIYEEDVVEEDDLIVDGGQGGLNEPLEIMDNYTKNLERRSRAYSNRGSQYGKPNQEVPQNEDGECQTVFQRSNSDGEVNFDDFRILSIVGKGTFGKVYLVQHIVSKRFFAMKSIRKDIVIEHDSLENLHLEKLILLQVNHPFIISMEFVFIKSLRIYFIMDFIRGGELFKHLSESKRFSEDRTRFYSAQVALALGYLHKARIIYRDMKPENILLNHDGYILLADFGLAKINDIEGDEPNSFCGTPEYLSPEMIVGSGHDHTLDWWALGILIYEMIIGIPPFYNKNKHQMYYLIQHAPIRWPEKERHGISVSEEAKDLISRLLEKDRKKRLGQKNDVDDVLGHPFFKGIDLEKLIKKELPPPFIPKLQSEYDLSNFDQKYVKLDLTESVLPEEGIQKIQAKKDAFEKFGFASDQQ